jgi:hypothetical protein
MFGSRIETEIRKEQSLSQSFPGAPDVTPDFQPMRTKYTRLEILEERALTLTFTFDAILANFYPNHAWRPCSSFSSQSSRQLSFESANMLIAATFK